jgi:hypothetical protein
MKSTLVNIQKNSQTQTYELTNLRNKLMSAIPIFDFDLCDFLRRGPLAQSFWKHMTIRATTPTQAIEYFHLGLIRISQLALQGQVRILFPGHNPASRTIPKAMLYLHSLWAKALKDSKDFDTFCDNLVSGQHIPENQQEEDLLMLLCEGSVE